MMKREGPAGCGLMILGIIALFLSVIPTGFQSGTSAAQATQLYAGATMWTTLLVAFGIGLLILIVDVDLAGIEHQVSQATPALAMPTPKIWEYCDLMEGRVRDGQTGEVRQAFRLLYHYQTGAKEQLIPSLTDALSHLTISGWDLVSVHTVPYSASISETHWVFKRPVPPQQPMSAQAETKGKDKKQKRK